MRLALALVIGSAGLAPAASPDPADLVPTPEIQVRCRALVRQLGSEDYEQREEAQKQLAALGRAARPALLAGAAGDDPEIRSRCGQLLPKATELDFQARLETFLADTDGRYEHDLPGWKAFRAVVCDEWKFFGHTLSSDRALEKAARAVFAEVLAARANRTLLRAVDGSRFELAEMVVARKMELYEGRAPRRGNATGNSPTLEDVVAITFADAQVGSNDPPRRGSFVTVMAESGLTAGVGAAGDRGKVYRALVAAWLDSRTEPRDMSTAMSLAVNLDLPDHAANLAARLLVTPGITASYRSRAASNLVYYGSAKHIPLVEKALTTATVVYTAQVPSASGSDPTLYEVRACDVALAASVKLAGQQLADYGFVDRYPDGSGPGARSYSYTRYYFEDAAARKKAFDKWAEWRKAYPDR